ncbi:hypothetical protein Nepgr_020315 [Nepenthes gracilis]|uniref:Receptor ligand binding region domain-containing protein n=1 Tax=Nepenthes gracilis TaxID=150966 RepID=A0AAD3SWR4_NEPGR|nr:hypothetical protein Nepgr_020315 [Nepenthes gracilis]
MDALLLLLLCMLEPLAVKGEARNVSSYFSQSKSVNIGTLFTFNSVIGRAAKPTIADIDDINSNSSILFGTKLHIIFHDTSCSVFLGIMEALHLMEKDVAVALGPQSSGITHVNSDIANELHLPLLSLATNPTLFALQFIVFLHVTRNAVDGRNGDSASGDALASKRANFSYKAAFSPSALTNDISNLRGEVNLMESRVIVVHALYFCVPFREKLVEYYEKNTNPANAEEKLLTCLADLFTQISSQKKKTSVISPKQNSPSEKIANGPLNGQANGGLKEPLGTGVQSYLEKKLLHGFWLSSFNLEVVKFSGTQRIRHAKGEAEELT